MGYKVLLGTVSPRLWKSESVPPDAEETFILDLSHVFEQEGGYSMVSIVFVTGAQKRGLKCSLQSKGDDAYKPLLK